MSVGGPSHGFPLFLASFFPLKRVRVPFPQVTEHPEKAPQGFQVQSSGQPGIVHFAPSFSAAPVQVPPFIGGFSTVRLLTRVPFPQVTLQVHSDHLDHSQLTGQP